MPEHIPTLADLCSAIADGQISAEIDGQMYQINARELRRYFNPFRSISTISLPNFQDAAPHSPPNACPVSTRSSVA